jgi:hypothetical protein
MSDMHAYDVANITGIYNRDPTNYQWLCRKCHVRQDGRLEKFIDRNATNNMKGENNPNYGKGIHTKPDPITGRFCGDGPTTLR